MEYIAWLLMEWLVLWCMLTEALAGQISANL